MLHLTPPLRFSEFSAPSMDLIGTSHQLGWWALRAISRGLTARNTVAGIPGTYGPTLAGLGGFLTPGPSSTVRETWDSSLRGRIGYLLIAAVAVCSCHRRRLLEPIQCNRKLPSFSPQYQVFLTEGPGVQILPTHPPRPYPRRKLDGTLGAGVETALAPNLLLRAEYRYADYGTISHTYFAPSQLDNVSADIKIQTHMALIGLAYKF